MLPFVLCHELTQDLSQQQSLAVGWNSLQNGQSAKAMYLRTSPKLFLAFLLPVASTPYFSSPPPFPPGPVVWVRLARIPLAEHPGIKAPVRPAGQHRVWIVALSLAFRAEFVKEGSCSRSFSSFSFFSFSSLSRRFRTLQSSSSSSSCILRMAPCSAFTAEMAWCSSSNGFRASRTEGEAGALGAFGAHGASLELPTASSGSACSAVSARRSCSKIELWTCKRLMRSTKMSGSSILSRLAKVQVLFQLPVVICSALPVRRVHRTAWSCPISSGIWGSGKSQGLSILTTLKLPALKSRAYMGSHMTLTLSMTLSSAYLIDWADWALLWLGSSSVQCKWQADHCSRQESNRS